MDSRATSRRAAVGFALRAGVAGSAGASVLLSEGSAFGASPEEMSAAGGDYSIDEVTAEQDASAGAQLVANSGEFRASGFPPGWALVAGDLVIVDHATGEALPYVTFDGTSKWYSVNKDRSRDRLIAEREHTHADAG